MKPDEIRAAMATLGSATPGGLLRTSDLRHPLLEASVPWHEGLQALSFLKLLWLSIPLAALNPRTRDIAPHVVDMANYLYGEESWTADDLKCLRVILIRIRQYVTLGRRVSPLGDGDFLRLLASQNGRCGLCAYKFRPEDIDARDYLLEPNFESQGASLRPPQVDHVLPVFIGGDSRANLQILCNLCNASKGNFCGWFESRVCLPARRPSDVWRVTQTERWAVLSRDAGCVRCGRGVLQLADNEEFTVTRADPKRAWLFENLQTVCTTCIDGGPGAAVPLVLDDPQDEG